MNNSKIIIIGAGPTGCTLALLLAHAGISVTLVESNVAPQAHPAACILSTRTMEIFREIDVEPLIIKNCDNMAIQGNITWIVSLAGRELGSCSPMAADMPILRTLSSTHTVQYPQNRLEPLLWDLIKRNSGVTFLPGHQCRTVGQDADLVRAVVVDQVTGQETTLEGLYLVACDGASSTVRRTLGIAVNGSIQQYMIGIHFFSNLSHYVEHRRSLLYWVLNRDLLGVLIAHWHPNEWVLFTPYFPPQQSLEEFTRSVSTSLIHNAVGTSTIPDLEIKHVASWVLGVNLPRSSKTAVCSLRATPRIRFRPPAVSG